MEGYDTRALGFDTPEPSAAHMVRQKGVWGGGRRVGFHEGQKTDGSDERRARKRAMVQPARSHAALVFDGDRAIGWAQYEPRAELPYIKNRRAFGARGAGAAPAGWRISCFCVDTDDGRRGAGARALEGTTGEVAQAGGGRIAACPEATEGQKTSAGFHRNPTPGMFEQTGADPTRKTGTHRWLVRRTVEGALR